MPVKVDTRSFRRKHGHEPRGRFLWTFRFNTERWYFTMRGKYEECRAAAIEAAEKRGTEILRVSSVVFGQDPGR